MRRAFLFFALLIPTLVSGQGIQHDRIDLSPNAAMEQTYAAGSAIANGQLLKITNGTTTIGGFSYANVIPLLVTDSTGVLGIADGAAASGTAVRVRIAGQGPVLVDGATCAVSYVLNPSSTVAGSATCVSSPGASQTVGYSLSVSSAPGIIAAAINAGGGGGGGGGGAPPIGNVGDIQLKASSAAFGASHISDTGSTLNLTENLAAAGPNPSIDVTAPPYNARAVPANISTTCTINAASTSCVLASASTFQNGDGVDVATAGATNTLATPGACTLTPSVSAAPIGAYKSVNAPTGSTSFQYQIVARTKGKGLTAAGTACNTTTGNALGFQSVSLSTYTRSGQAVTFTTLSPHGLVTGSHVFISTTSPIQFNGEFLVASTADNTHFVVNTGASILGGAPASGTGGTVSWFNDNHLSWTAVPNAWQYIIYGRVSGTMVLLGVTRPGEVQWEDFGSPMMDGISLPSYYPSSPPGAATNDDLVTTICSGAGTTSVTLCDPAINSATTATFIKDDAPTIRAAAVVAVSNTGNASQLRLPFPTTTGSSYILNSILDLSALGGGFLNTLECGPVTANETVILNTNQSLDGSCAVPAQGNAFSWQGGAQFTVNRAFPGIYYVNSGGSSINHITMTVKNQGLGIQLQGVSNHFNYTLKNSNITVGTASADYTGLALVYYGTANTLIQNTYIAMSSPSNTFGVTSAPAVLGTNNGATGNGPGTIYADYCFFTTRAFAVVSIPSIGGGVPFEFKNCYTQGAIEPFVTFATQGRQNFVSIYSLTPDTSSSPTVATLSGSASTLFLQDVGAPGSTWPMITGSGFLSTQISSGAAAIGGSPSIPGAGYGQNNNEVKTQVSQLNPASPYNTVNPSQSSYATTEFREIVHFPAQHQEYWDIACPTTVSATPAAGGTIAAGTYFYQVVCIPAGGGQSSVSSPSGSGCVLSGGNGTCAVSWTPVEGAVAYNVYRCQNSGCTGSVFAVTNGSGIITASLNDTTNSLNSGSSPSATAGGGYSGIGYGLLWGPAAGFTLTSPIGANNVSFKASFATPLTANRTYTFPDATGTLCLTTTCGGNFYQTLLNNTVAQPQEPAFDLIAGTNMTITCTDSPGVKSACTFIASSSAATAFSAITASSNSNTGTFAMIGNTLDLSAAAAAKMPTVGVGFPGSSSGLVTVEGAASAGTWTFMLPTAPASPASGAFLTTDASGVGSFAQVDFSKLTGSLACSQMPALTGDVNSTAATCFTSVLSVHGVTYGASPGTNTVPVVTSSGVTTYEAVPNAALANSSLTINSQSVSLGGTATIPFQTNGSSNTSQAGINFKTSTVNGIGGTITPSNALGTNQESFELTGVITPAGGACGVSNPAAHQISITEGSSVCNFVPSPTVNGSYALTWNVTAGAGVDPVAALSGLGSRSIVGSASTDTVTYADSGKQITHDKAGSAGVTETLPTATTLGNPNFVYAYCNHSTQTDTITPTTWTIQGGNASAGATLTVTSGACYRISVDANSSTQWHADTYGVSSITGDGTLFNNANSTQNVVLTLANAPPNSFFGNPTGSPAAPIWNTITFGGTVTSVTCGAPLSGGTITTTGTCSGPTILLGSSLALGVVHAPGSSQTMTSSLIAIADLSATGTPSSTTFLRGDNTWGTPSGTGNTTSTSLTSGVVPKANGANSIIDSLLSDSGTALTYTGTGGVSAPSYSATGSTAGYFICIQGSDNGVGAANTITTECPAAVTAYEIIMPGVAGTANQLLQIASVSSNKLTMQWGTVSGGGDTITTPNSTLAVGGTSTNTTLDLVGSAGEIMAGATPALTYTPTLGKSGTAGTLSLFPSSGNFTTTLASAATASNTVNFFATVPTNNHTFYCAVTSTTCTLTDSGYAYNSIPNADLANSAITIAGTSVSLGSSTSSFPTPGAIGGTTPAAGTFTTLTANTSFVVNGGTAQTGTQGTDTKLLTAGTVSGTAATLCTDANGGATTSGCGGSMVYPGAGIANSTGSAWGTSYTTSGSGTVLCLTTSCVMTTPNLGTPSAINLTNATSPPTWNQNTTGSAAKWTTARNLAGNSVDGSADVAFANKFIVQGTTDAGLSSAQFLGALATGLVKNTTTTGVLSIAVSADVYALWSGTCSSSTFLRGDGACAAPSGSGNTTSTSLTTGQIPKANGANSIIDSLLGDNGTTLTYTGTGGAAAPAFTATGTTAGFIDFPQGSTSAAVAPCNTATSICWQAPSAVTSYLVNLPGAAANGVVMNTNVSGVITQSFSGDSSHSILQTSKTAAISTATLCAATAGTACGQAGMYNVSVNFWGSGTACSSITAGQVTFLLTWTDENAVTHSAVAISMDDQTAAAVITRQSVFHFETSLANESASGSFNISTNGSIIQYATGYTACTTGTGTYNLRATVTQIQ